MLKQTIIKLWTILIFLTGSIWGSVYYLLKSEYALLSLFSIIGGVFVWMLYHVYRQNEEKIAFLFASIENDDYSFKFTEDKSLIDDPLLNAVLNRIKDVMMQAKLDMVQNEKYYELIMDSIGTGVVVISEAGSVYQNNGAALRMLGLPVLTHINQLKKIDPSLTDTMSAITPDTTRQVSFNNNRGTVNLSLWASSLGTRHGATLKIIAMSDIGSELESREIESWIRLTRVLTHEIMNSITPITSLSDTLLTLYGPCQDNIRSGLEVINTTGKGLISFVESYRKFTRIPKPELSLFYVKQFMERMMTLLDCQCESTISIDIEPEDLIIHADENLISQVVINLLKNAIEATNNCRDRQAEIRIKAFCTIEEYVMVEISNNGDPIPAEVVENIFVPFFTTKDGGSGVGLSISRQIMKAHNGSLILRSSDEIQTVFVLTFK